MATKIHRRTPSNDGTVETILSSLGPSRSSSNSSNNTMDTHDKDIESFHPLLPTRGRSSVAANHQQQQQQQSNGIVMIETKHDNNDSDSTKSDSVKISGSAWKAIMACLNYSFCSVSMILVNKSLASR
jgi:uncharacterized protein involved in tellurium resistance